MNEGVILLPHTLNPDSAEKKVWDHVVWGDPAGGVFGRYSYALKLFFELHHVRGKAPYIYIGNGHHLPTDGRSEAEYTRDFILSHASEVNPSFERIKEILLKRMILAPQAGQNTLGEVTGCFDVCVAQNFHHVILVTSPYHAPRSYRDALAIRSTYGHSVRVTAEASDTDPPGCNASLVEIKEPQYNIR